MSAYVDVKGNFTDIYGTAILAMIKNMRDLDPLMVVASTVENLVLVSKPHVKVFDVFSQTLASVTGDRCKRIDEWFAERGGSYTPYNYMDYDVILDSHYLAKDVLKELIPNPRVVHLTNSVMINNNRLVLRLDMELEEQRLMKRVVSSLNDVYGVRRGISRHIVLGYFKSAPAMVSEAKVAVMSSLVPKALYIDHPDVYHYCNMNEYSLYSSRLY